MSPDEEERLRKMVDMAVPVNTGHSNNPTKEIVDQMLSVSESAVASGHVRAIACLALLEELLYKPHRPSRDELNMVIEVVCEGILVSRNKKLLERGPSFLLEVFAHIIASGSPYPTEAHIRWATMLVNLACVARAMLRRLEHEEDKEDGSDDPE